MSVVARDPLNRPLTYSFSADAGAISHASPSDPTARWTAPSATVTATIRCTVKPAGGPSASAQANVAVEIGKYLRGVTIGEVRATRITALFDGRMLVADGASGILAAVSPVTGQISWQRTQLATPVAVAATVDELYVLERGTQRISVWTPRGEPIRDFAIEASLPNDMTIGPNPGELVVSDTEAARLLIV